MTSSGTISVLLNNSIKPTTLFKQEEPKCCWPCKTQVTYRIPALIYISDSQTFLAFAEKRKTSDDTDAEVLVMRRGIWKDRTVKWISGYQVLTFASLPNHRSMNPCPVYERKSKTLFMFFICVPIGVSEQKQIKEGKNQARLCYVSSKDTGKTWSPVIDLTANVIADQVKDWATFAVGPGHGIQMQNERLIIPAYAYRNTGKPYAFAFYSDDNGRTWKVGKQMDVESCECQMAEITDDKGNSALYCNARTSSGFRTEALSLNSGELFNDLLSPKKLKETGYGCQGSVLSFLPLDQTSPSKAWLLYSHPSNLQKREALGIYLNKSPWDASGWNDKPSLIIYNGPSGYSDLAEYEHGFFACLMECGQKSENEEIAFLLFELPKKTDA